MASRYWTFPGQEGKLAQVDVYSVDDEVELLVNGVSLGRKPAGAAPSKRSATSAGKKPVVPAW